MSHAIIVLLFWLSVLATFAFALFNLVMWVIQKIDNHIDNERTKRDNPELYERWKRNGWL